MVKQIFSITLIVDRDTNEIQFNIVKNSPSYPSRVVTLSGKHTRLDFLYLIIKQLSIEQVDTDDN